MGRGKQAAWLRKQEVRREAERDPKEAWHNRWEFQVVTSRCCTNTSTSETAGLGWKPLPELSYQLEKRPLFPA